MFLANTIAPKAFEHGRSSNRFFAWLRLPLAIGYAGEHYAAIFGCNQSGLEAVLLKRRVMIPCWVSLKHPTRIEAVTQVILRSKRF